MSEEINELIKKSPLFSGFSDHQLQSVFERAEIIKFSKGEVIVEEGSPGDCLYILVEGSVDIEKRTHEGRVVKINSISGKGDFFGEMALIDILPRSATVRAGEPVTVIKISNSAMASFFESDEKALSTISLNIARNLCRRLRNADEAIAALTV